MGYNSEGDTWEPEDNLTGCEEAKRAVDEREDWRLAKQMSSGKKKASTEAGKHIKSHAQKAGKKGRIMQRGKQGKLGLTRVAVSETAKKRKISASGNPERSSKPQGEAPKRTKTSAGGFHESPRHADPGLAAGPSDATVHTVCPSDGWRRKKKYEEEEPAKHAESRSITHASSTPASFGSASSTPLQSCPSTQTSISFPIDSYSGSNHGGFGGDPDGSHDNSKSDKGFIYMVRTQPNPTTQSCESAIRKMQGLARAGEGVDGAGCLSADV